jgi:uncharacterized lipoprotein YmbA
MIVIKRRLFIALPALLAACASPDPTYYTLRAVRGAELTGGVKLVELRRIGLAGYLDRSEIVRNQADYRISVGANERWGEPLGQLVARTLAEDLNQRLPGTSVFTAAGSISADPDISIEMDLQRFDADASGQVVVLAQVAITRTLGRDHAAAQTVRLMVTPADNSTTALAAALSTALGQLADRIAPLLLR